MILTPAKRRKTETRSQKVIDIPDTQSQEDSALAGKDEGLIQEMQAGRMSPCQLQSVLQKTHLLPTNYRQALLSSKYLSWLPESMFRITYLTGKFDNYNETIGRILFEEDRSLVEEMVRFDFSILKKQQGSCNVRKLRSFFYQKYSIRTKELRDILETYTG